MKTTDLHQHIGTTLTTTEWRRISQADIDAFGQATGDTQWIHTDPERAKHSPLGTTIAHGLLLVSWLPMLLQEALVLEDAKYSLNYGYDKIRFVQPVPVGSRVRLVAQLIGVEGEEQGYKIYIGCTVELEGSEKPACVAESIAMVIV